MPAILVPVDGSIHALKALSIACDLAEKHGGHIAILSVLARDRHADKLLELPVARAFPKDIRAELEALASRRQGSSAAAPALSDRTLNTISSSILQEAEARIRRRGHEVERLPVVDGNPAEAILSAARRVSASTIVMGCRGLGETESSSFGSVSQQVFRNADCTCISVK